MQTEALAKLKRGGEQTVRVEHVHVYPGGQAIVGAVSTQRAEGGVADERGNQADGAIDARAIVFAPGAAMSISFLTSASQLPSKASPASGSKPSAWTWATSSG
jgi:hypothetical protein